ncbi:MAG: ABC transporter permease [Nocardioidaceae bacterium]
MMSTQVATPASTSGKSAISAVPFSRLLAVELRKLVDTRAGKWLLIAIGLVTLAVIVIFLFVADSAELTFSNFVDATATPQGLLLPVLGILAVTSEWSQRTGLVTFTLEPSRQRVVTAKFVALLILGLAAVLLAIALAAAGNGLGMALRDGDGSWSFGLGGIRDVFLLQGIGLIQGFAFGMLFMNSAAAIVLYFILPIASSFLFQIVTWLKDHLAEWIDLGTAQTPLQTHEMGGNDWAQLGVACLIWVALPFVIGLIRLLRSELKSA